MHATLRPGLERTERIDVDLPRTIGFLGEDGRVYSTPSMVNDIEYACLRLIDEHLDASESSVGAQVAVEHLAPTPRGQWVEIRVRVVKVEGRRVELEAQVLDALECVGRGRHTRVVVDVERQVARVRAKAAGLG